MKTQKQHLNAIAELNEEDVRQQARASTARYQSGKHLGMIRLLSDICEISKQHQQAFWTESPFQ